MDKRQVIENLNKSLSILKEAETVTLSDRTLKTLTQSIEEAVRILDDGWGNVRTTKETKSNDTEHTKDETIDSLGLSPRSSNALKRAGCMYIKDLRGIKPQQLKGIKGLGNTSLNEIMEKAREHGVKISR
ncbi:MAG: hypothetical protein J6M92_06485 [Oribacterium sp.]|nr:hypothetical protein [Oribacterium sp.]